MQRAARRALGKYTSVMASTSPIRQEIPAGYTVHRESTTEILVPAGQGVFINPIQEFNRDISIAAIGAWSAIFDCEKRAAWDKKQSQILARPAKKRKLELNAEESPAIQLDHTDEVIARWLPRERSCLTVSKFHF